MAVYSDSTNLGINETNIIYVGKHGDDNNDGLTIDRAKLTFGSAMTAASSGDVITCLDNGSYTENITGKTNVDIYAPSITITGAHTMEDSSRWEFGTISVADATTGITVNGSAGLSMDIVAKSTSIAGSGIGIVNTQGRLNIDILSVRFTNGYFIGPTTDSSITVRVGELQALGTGTAFACITGEALNITAARIANSGVGDGQLFETSGAGTPEINATITYVDLEKLSDITAGSNVTLVTSSLQGTLAEAGGGNVTIGGATRIDNIPIGVNTPSNGAFTTLSATTSFRAPWTEVTGATQALAVNHNYTLNRGAGVVATLPAAAAVGDIIEIQVSGAGAGQIAQNALQTIRFGTSSSTTGVGGSITSTAQYDSVRLVCIVTNTDFAVLSSIGNWTVT